MPAAAAAVGPGQASAGRARHLAPARRPLDPTTHQYTSRGSVCRSRHLFGDCSCGGFSPVETVIRGTSIVACIANLVGSVDRESGFFGELKNEIHELY